jgi:hypothetical protein
LGRFARRAIVAQKAETATFIARFILCALRLLLIVGDSLGRDAETEAAFANVQVLCDRAPGHSVDAEPQTSS